MYTHIQSRSFVTQSDSALKQTYHHFELINIDDGSSDGTEEVVRSFDDKRIVYHWHE
ncbi:MAG: glycosyltransferase family 2 protein [Planctomycetes bacterium]|nr:glycosyltransferase family 2 protein [Planctomycetota bacterium]